MSRPNSKANETNYFHSLDASAEDILNKWLENQNESVTGEELPDYLWDEIEKTDGGSRLDSDDIQNYIDDYFNTDYEGESKASERTNQELLQDEDNAKNWWDNMSVDERKRYTGSEWSSKIWDADAGKSYDDLNIFASIAVTDIWRSTVNESKASLKSMKDSGAGDMIDDIPDGMDLDEWVGESKASEDFVTYDIDGNVITRKEEPDGTFEDMMARSDDPEKTLNAWNNIVRILEEEEQKKSTESNEDDDYEYGFIPKVSGFGEDKDKNLPIKDHTHNFTSGYQHSNGIDYTWQCSDSGCGATKNQDLYMESKASENPTSDGYSWSADQDEISRIQFQTNLTKEEKNREIQKIEKRQQEQTDLELETDTPRNRTGYFESKASESFDMHSDAGHGWLEVPKSLLKELGIGKDISMMSYQKGNSVFIEEDGDLSTFKRAYEEKYGSLSINELPQTDDESPIRDYYPYGGESKANEYSIKEEFDLQDQDGKYEMLSKADLSVTDATKYSTYSHSELPEEVKDSLKGDEDSYGESWSRKSSIDRIEALERLGIKQGDAIQLSGLEFEDYAEDLQGALIGELIEYNPWESEDDLEGARKQMTYQTDYLNNSSKSFGKGTMGFDWQEGEEVENPNSEFQQYYPDYNNIGESQTSRTKYECEYCDHGFKSNEALSIHYNDKHAIAPESLDGYDYAEKPYWLKLQERTIIHKNFDPIWGSPDRANDDDLHEYGNPESSEGDTLKCSHCGQIFNPDNEQVLYSHLAGHGITESKASETISDYEREQRRLNYEEELTEEEKSTQASYFNKLHNDSLDRKNKQFMEDEQVFGEPEEMYGMLGMESKANEFGDYEVKCDTCDGKGYELEWSGSKQEYFEDPCDTCGGKGTNTWTSKVGKSDESKASEGEGLPYAMGNYTDWFSQAWGDDADQSAIPNTVQCEDCFDQFNVENQQGMINHINSKHDANIDPVTGESKASEAGLDDHSCPECGFITSDNSDYVDHLNAHEE